jgi:hypothetical protein
MEFPAGLTAEADQGFYGSPMDCNLLETRDDSQLFLPEKPGCWQPTAASSEVDAAIHGREKRTDYRTL